MGYRVRSLDMQLEATKRLQFAVEMMVQNNRHTENLYNELLSSRNANVRILSLMPGQAEALADRLAAAGEIETAEGAYERILNAYRAYRAIDMKAIKAGHEIKSLLLKMANIFLERGDHLRAESLMWEALESRDFPSEAQESDLEVLKCLANSLPQTSNELSTAIQSAFDGRVPSHLFSPFPPLQRMMQTRYASHFRGSPFHRGEYQEASAMSDVPILGGIETVLELLRVLPVGALAARDIYGQSPLYLAASLQMEGLGRAILLRITELPGLGIQSYINARDLSGQTVLGASICGGCSLDFVRHLIDHGAEVDPEPLKQLPLTPLQAAASMGSLDIVDLLLNCGAKTDRVYRGNKTALTFAEEDRHEAIVRRLRDTSEVYSSPNTVLRLQPP
jgi:tetratricopeptide (TPR) repeat protein